MLTAHTRRYSQWGQLTAEQWHVDDNERESMPHTRQSEREREREREGMTNPETERMGRESDCAIHCITVVCSSKIGHGTVGVCITSITWFTWRMVTDKYCKSECYRIFMMVYNMLPYVIICIALRFSNPVILGLIAFSILRIWDRNEGWIPLYRFLG